MMISLGRMRPNRRSDTGELTYHSHIGPNQQQQQPKSQFPRSAQSSNRAVDIIPIHEQELEE